jgi:adenine-specific DNA methylase
MNNVRYLLKREQTPSYAAKTMAILYSMAVLLAKDILKLTNYSSITKRWTSTAWTTAGETRWNAQSSTNMDKETELLID